MRYNIHGRLIYDAMDGTLTLPGSDEADSQLSITANALLWFFLRHTEVVSRDEVLKKVWDDNGLTSSNSNLNQYLSMLRKTFRHYDIDNIIVTVRADCCSSIRISPSRGSTPARSRSSRPRQKPSQTRPQSRKNKRPFPAATRAVPAGISPAAACSLSPCCWWSAVFSAAAHRTPSP
ncbi:putative transcriptional regulatory protein [Klebsiella michiganensis]|nr:putative transcriptional regulatory protein [Klebsiella michiganensis]